MCVLFELEGVQGVQHHSHSVPPHIPSPYTSVWLPV